MNRTKPLKRSTIRRIAKSVAKHASRQPFGVRLPRTELKPGWIYAYCTTDGRIRFGRVVPQNALSIICGSSASVRAAIEITARLSYPSKPGAQDAVLLVPGIPEAEDQMSAVKALSHYIDHVEFCMSRNVEWLKPVSAERRMRILRTALARVSLDALPKYVERLTAV